MRVDDKADQKHFLPLIRLIIPLVITGIIQSLSYLLMNVFLAKLGQHIFAAGALVNWMEATLIVFLFGTLGSISVLVAHEHGAKNELAIAGILRDGLLLSLVLSIILFFLYFHMSSIFLILGQSPEIAKYSNDYLRALSWGLFPTFAVIVFLEVIVGLGKSKLVLVFNLILAGLSVFFSYIFIFGKFGLPAMGIAGAGWGVTISQVLACIVFTFYMLKQAEYRFYFKNIFCGVKSYLLPIVQIGLPQGLMYCIEVGYFFAVALCMGYISIDLLAANQLVMQYLGLFISICFSIAQAVTVRMGYLIGARCPQDAKRVVNIGIYCAAILMLIVLTCFILKPMFFLSLIIDIKKSTHVAVIHYAAGFLILCGILQLVEGVRVVLFGCLRALKDTHFSMITSIISFWFLALPLGYWLAMKEGVGGNGFWIALIVGSIANTILLFTRLRNKLAHL